MRTILSFDIGIKNLAWCLMQKNVDISGSLFEIIGWENVNLLQQDVSKDIKKITCWKCAAKPTHIDRATEQISCGRHSTKPIFKDLSGSVFKKIPPMKDIKVLLAHHHLPKAKTKEEAEKYLSSQFAMPVEIKKQKKAIDTELSILHDAIRRCVQERKTLFEKADAIHLENQPVLKNPTMKSVQILLFATLRDLLQPNPPTLKLIHAGMKVKGVQSGDAGYKERKHTSEEQAKALLLSVNVKVAEAKKWSLFLEKHTKQNDLTDAFCMCINGLS